MCGAIPALHYKSSRRGTYLHLSAFNTEIERVGKTQISSTADLRTGDRISLALILASKSSLNLIV
jgi:hypothetical protein